MYKNEFKALIFRGYFILKIILLIQQLFVKLHSIFNRQIPL